MYLRSTACDSSKFPRLKARSDRGGDGGVDGCGVINWYSRRLGTATARNCAVMKTNLRRLCMAENSKVNSQTYATQYNARASVAEVGKVFLFGMVARGV